MSEHKDEHLTPEPEGPDTHREDADSGPEEIVPDAGLADQDADTDDGCARVPEEVLTALDEATATDIDDDGADGDDRADDEAADEEFDTAAELADQDTDMDDGLARIPEEALAALDEDAAADVNDDEADGDDQADKEVADEESDVVTDDSESKEVVASSSAGEVSTSAPEEPAAKDRAPAGGHEMSFIGHLQELRQRLTRCIIGMFVGFLACYGFSEQLFLKLMEPLTDLLLPAGGSLIYTGLPEAFFVHLKTAAVAGVFLASPYIFYQLWMFVAPGLYDNERKWIIPIALCSAVCFVTGALFGYFIVFPFGFQFFLGYATDFIQPMPSVKEYFSFATSLLFAFGIIFELPLVMLFLSTLGVVTHKGLRKYRKYAILGNFIVGAILTPPDVVSQVLMAGPMCLLYEIGIIVAWIFGKKPKEPEPPASEEEAAAS